MRDLTSLSKHTIYVYLYIPARFDLALALGTPILCKSSGQCAPRCGMMSGWVRSPRRKVKTGTDSISLLPTVPTVPTVPIQSPIMAQKARGQPSRLQQCAAAINAQVNHLLVKEVEGLRNPRYISIVVLRSSPREFVIILIIMCDYRCTFH